MRKAAIIVGMSSPTGEPLAIDGVPRGAAGHRLWRMSGLSREEWLTSFFRTNLIPPGKKWTDRLARQRAFAVIDLAVGRDVVVLGNRVWKFLGFPLEKDVMVTPNDTTWYRVPHPSGRNLKYNDPAERQRVGAFLKRLARC
jgi:hypothetical protein